MLFTIFRTEHFNTHKRAFKLFFWALIRTGNPQFAGQCPLHVNIDYDFLEKKAFSPINIRIAPKLD